MEFSEDYIPESIFLYLFREDFLFGFTESDIVTISLDDFMSIPFTYPIPEIIPDHRTETCKENCSENMLFSPESSDKDHDIHPWHCRTDNWKRFNTGRCECNKIIPISKDSNKFSNPLDSIFDPVGFHERYQEEYE